MGNIQTYQLQMINSGGGGGGGKLPNENIQTYQLQMINSGVGVGGKLPNANCDYQTTK